MSGSLPQKIYTCEIYQQFKCCPTNCVRPDITWTVDCYECRGNINPECELCEGSGRVTHSGCPRLAAREYSYLLPYFQVWKISECRVWPDGRAMLYQPLKLIRAFDLLLWWYTNIEQKKVEQEKRKHSKGKK